MQSMRSKLLADAIGLIFFLALPMPAFAFATDVVLYYFGQYFSYFWFALLDLYICIQQEKQYTHQFR